MRQFIIPENLAAAVQNYLATRPLKETFDMFNALGQLQELPKPAAPEKKSETPTAPLDSKPEASSDAKSEK